MLLLLLYSFLAGVFTALSPCILPVLPAILTAGIAEGRLRPLGTILGLICSFSFFTLALTWIVHATGISSAIFRYVAIVLIAFFGLVMLFPKLSNWFAQITAPIADLGQKIQGEKPRKGFWGGVVFGIALGLLWTPCAGPILGSITTLVATGGVHATAVLMTLSYSIGAGIPMLLYAYGSSKLLSSVHFLSRYVERIRQFFGILMLIFAAILLFNWDMLINEKISRIFPEQFSEKNLKIEKTVQSIHSHEKLSDMGPAPEITGITQWINSSPLSLSELRGKVVLIDFWTYSCINCIRTLPHVENWYRDYKDYGFVVIGVHTPEFEFEKKPDNVKKAVAHFGITYPVALDNDYATWNAFHNYYWPADYLIDQNGIIRMTHFGEGEYDETENAIRALLNMPPLEIQKTEEINRPVSPETYLGFDRGHSYSIPITPNETEDYTYEGPLEHDKVGLKGLWYIGDEYILSESEASYLDCHFLASQIYLVLEGSSSTPLEIILDGKPYKTLCVDSGKKYDIVSTFYGWHLLSLKVPQGVKAYSFSFSSD
jgi:cytochrome c biogenesis protein CcdA/thiol-disulfide isomerase/thioredoxin